MSMHSTLQAHHLRNLILILRRANDHYAYVAARIRSAYQPKLHARKRAQKLGLSINISKAIACPQKHVSNVPLPIIEVPTPQVFYAPSPLIQDVPFGGAPPSPMDIANLPLLYPSHWSAFDEDGYIRDDPEILSESPDGVYPMGEWSTLDEMLDDDNDLPDYDLQYPQSATDDDGNDDDDDFMDWDGALQYPQSAEADSAPAPLFVSGAQFKSALTSSSASSSSEDDHPPLVIRIKRKPVQNDIVDPDMGEKRPRTRYSCVVRETERGHVIRVPPRL